MISRFLSLLCLIGFFPLNGQTAEIKHVFILSFDQGTPWVIQKADMPLFHEMAKTGAHTWEAFTIVPSLTLPSHTSMLTGVGIQKHQITWNDLEPDKGLVKVPTIFSLAKEKGLVTAMYVGKEKFKHLDLPHSLDAFVVAATDTAVAEAFAKDFDRLRPNLCFIHFPDPDNTGHQFGVDSPEQLQAFATADAALQIVRSAVQKAGLEDSSVFILTADHGAHNRPAEEIAERIKRGEPPIPGVHGDASPSDVTIPWIAWGTNVKPNFTITAPVIQYDTAATALWLLGVPIPEHFWGRPVISAFAESKE